MRAQGMHVDGPGWVHLAAVGMLLLAASCVVEHHDGGRGEGGAPADRTDAGPGSDCSKARPGSIWALWRMPNPTASGLPNPASYTNLGDGTVRDNVTCLVWQRDVSEGGYSWTEANDYCRDLPLAGGGWRLPSRIELVSLIDFTKGYPGPAIDTEAFPSTPAEVFWSSSPADDTSLGMVFAWYVNFNTGATSSELPELESRARCVR
jgi:hypothetical protein